MSLLHWNYVAHCFFRWTPTWSIMCCDLLSLTSSWSSRQSGLLKQSTSWMHTTETEPCLVGAMLCLLLLPVVLCRPLLHKYWWQNCGIFVTFWSGDAQSTKMKWMHLLPCKASCYGKLHILPAMAEYEAFEELYFPGGGAIVIVFLASLSARFLPLHSVWTCSWFSPFPWTLNSRLVLFFA